MRKGLITIGVGIVLLSLSAAPTFAKHHKGEKPEVKHTQKGKKPAAKPARAADDKGVHPEPGDDRGQGGHGKDDGPNHR